MSANIQLKIEKLSQFAKEGPNSRRLSDAVYLRGLPWKILAIPREADRCAHKKKCLSYFLQCNGNNADPAWSCACLATLKIVAQKNSEEDHERKITHVFHAKENDWGFAQYMSFEALMDPVRGLYDNTTDSIILSVDFWACEPQGIKPKSNIQAIQQSINESAKGLTTKNAEYQKRKQELEINKKLALEKYQNEISQLEAENYERNADFAKEMTTLKDELKEKINWDQVDLVMGKKLVVNPVANGQTNCWNLTTRNKNSSFYISRDGLEATSTNSSSATATIYHNYKSVTADKGFHIFDNFAGPVLYYFEITIISAQYKGEILVGLSNGSIPDGSFVGELPNSYAIEDGCDHCWISEKTHKFEWPNGTTKPEWNGKGDVIGCGLLLNPGNQVSIFFTANGILMGKQIPINSTADLLYPTVSMRWDGSVEANFGNNLAKPFKYDIKKCPGMVMVLE